MLSQEKNPFFFQNDILSKALSVLLVANRPTFELTLDQGPVLELYIFTGTVITNCSWINISAYLKKMITHLIYKFIL